jgi:hypothetical protein
LVVEGAHIRDVAEALGKLESLLRESAKNFAFRAVRLFFDVPSLVLAYIVTNNSELDGAHFVLG